MRHSRPDRPRTRISNNPKFRLTDPERYHVRGLVSGSFEIIDKNTGKSLSQLDSRDEAANWITDKLAEYERELSKYPTLKTNN